MANDKTKSQQATAEAESPQSKDTSRTLLFVGCTVACLAITGVFEWSSRTKPIEEFGKVGQEFYEDFEDPTKASSLEVYAFDVESVQPVAFQVEKLDNGRWVIPSHHNYPTDAEDQLARTAASVIGIDRGAMVTRWESDHASYSVVNPKQDSLNVDDIEGIGKRIILRNENKEVLADYIIGKQVPDSFGEYYVRHPEEDEVYIATLRIDLSTKFSDWIKTDLLELVSSDINKLTINNYSFDELRGEVTQGEVYRLTRATTNDPWVFPGVDAEKEDINTEAIDATVNALGSLKIAGVRPKQEGLTPDLKLDRQALRSQRDLDRLQSDLLTRGFLLRPAEGGSPDALQLVAREGELTTTTSGGLVYKLHFGRAFTGSQEELEIGLTSAPEEASENGASENEPGETEDETEDETEVKGEEETPENGNPGRYVFVQVGFDENLLTKPEKPVEPTPPAVPAEEETDSGEDNASKDATGEDEGPTEEDAPAEEDTTEGSGADEESGSGDDASGCQDSNQDEVKPDMDEVPTQPETPEVNPADIAQQAYALAKSQYDAQLLEYERLLAEYETQVEAGKAKAEELNRRFAAWYYVIPGASYDSLKLSREDLVSPKAPDVGQLNQEAADQFLAENKARDGVMSTPSGLQYEVLVEGEGEGPLPTSRVKVKYKGTLLDGTVFDESGDQEIEFGVNQVIPGWTEALQLMNPGAKFKLYIPPDIAYGPQGSGEKIGPNSLLIFEVELISFE